MSALRWLMCTVLIAATPAGLFAQAELPSDPTGVDLLEATNPFNPFRVTVRTSDRKTRYVENAYVSFEVLSEKDCYITLVTIDSQGDVTLLLPNAWQKQAMVRANQPTQIPAEGAGFRFPVKPPHGHTRIRAIATLKPLKLNGVTLSTIQKQQFVALGNTKEIGEAGPKRARQFTDKPLNQMLDHNDWTTAELMITTLTKLPPVIEPTPASLPFSDPNEMLLKQWREFGGAYAGAVATLPRSDKAVAITELLVIRAPKGEKPASAAAALRRELLGEVERIDLTQGAYLATTRAEVASRIGQLRSQPGVLAVVPNHRFHVLAKATQRLAMVQWALKNEVSPDTDTGWHRVSKRVADLKPGLIGVIDQGINLEHKRLADIVWTNKGEIPDNGKDDDGNGLVDDVHGYNFVYGNNKLQYKGAGVDHGSIVSSIIAGKAVGQNGVAGMAPNAKVVPAVVVANRPNDKQLGWGDWAAIREGIAYAVAQGAKVINLSVGGSIELTDLMQINRDPIWDQLENRGVIVVCAAGNNGADIDKQPVFPGSLPRSNIVTVLAVDPAGRLGRFRDKDGTWRAFSNYGAGSVHLGAPGAMVMGVGADGRPMLLDGTSYAAPLVTAAASLVWAAHPEWDYRTVIRALIESTKPTEELRDRCIAGGMLDLEDALEWRPSSERGAPTVKVLTGKPLWLIGQFPQRDGWLAEHDQLTLVKRDWSRSLALALEQALRDRKLQTRYAGRELTEQEVQALIAEGLRYLCDGQLERLVMLDAAEGEKQGQLVIIYRLKKRVGDYMRIVQKRRLRVNKSVSGPMADTDLDEMLKTAAKLIAQRIIEDVPSDLHAARG